MQREDPRDFVVASFESLEDQLLACLDYIPYLAENKSVVSPRLVPILLEASSLTESVFRHAVLDSKRHTLKTYARMLEGEFQLEEASTLLLTSPLGFIRPFRDWTRTPPAWWDAYNRVKHDRVANYDAASLDHTVSALAALHQVLARSNEFVLHLAKAGWFNQYDEQFAEIFVGRAAGCGRPTMPVETKLFVSPTRDDFVDWNATPPQVENWEFSVRVKTFIFDHEGW